MVVNISSKAGQVPGRGELVYGASKAGLSAFGEALQFDGTRDGVRVLDVRLGAIRTNFTAARKDRDKFMDPAEVAEAIVGLCRCWRSLRIASVDIRRRAY